jgi:cell division protease FtsH
VDNRDKLEMMAEALMQYETIDAEQVEAIMAGRKPLPPKDWDGGSGATKAEVPVVAATLEEGQGKDTPNEGAVPAV